MGRKVPTEYEDFLFHSKNSSTVELAAYGGGELHLSGILQTGLNKHLSGTF